MARRIDTREEDTARRVRHLIVLPGGGADPVPDPVPEPTVGSAALQPAAVTAPLEAPAHPGLRLRLRVISRTVTAPKAPTMPFIIFASVLVSLAVLGLVVLRVMVDQASFHVDDLSTRVAQQQSSLTQLNYNVSVADAPGAIASRAAALGMVPATRIQPLPTPSAPAPAGGSTGSAAGSTSGGGG